MKMFQLLPGFNTGDAISNYTLSLHNLIRELGYEACILTVEKHTSMDARRFCFDYRNYTDVIKAEDIVMYHFSIGSELSDFFKKVKAKKLMVYHNVTPPQYFSLINPQLEKDLKRGIEEVRSLSSVADLALGVSDYDRNDLFRMGFKNTGRLWLLLDQARSCENFNNAILSKYNDEFINIISVGRMCPNKKFEDVIKSFYFYKNTINSKSRLFIVGSITGGSSYVEFLRGFCARLGLWDVVFTGHVRDEDLNSYYKIADVFVTMSEHEGFCVPLIEAMYFGIPIIAYGSSAIPETLGGAGVCVYEKKYEDIAELINVLVADAYVRNKVINQQNKRLKDFSSENLKEVLKVYLQKLL
jgi:glycosyltransferase involved in cell wall biosynthesis